MQGAVLCTNKKYNSPTRTLFNLFLRDLKAMNRNGKACTYESVVIEWSLIVYAWASACGMNDNE